MSGMQQYFLETERLYLREFEPSDVAFILKLDGDPRVMEFLRPPSKTIEDAVFTYEKIQLTRKKDIRFGNWVAVTKSTNNIIGWFCLKDMDNTPTIEVGYRLLFDYWGNGYATEGSRKLIEYGFTKCNLQTIAGVTHPLNVRSQHVLLKCGLTFKRKDFIYETDVYYYEINKADALI
jgi:[ribosomal protein S5]-alanine N-acetyltransferase